MCRLAVSLACAQSFPNTQLVATVVLMGVNGAVFGTSRMVPYALCRNCEFYQMQSREDYRARNSDDARRAPKERLNMLSSLEE